jgi:hypothetical protein
MMRLMPRHGCGSGRFGGATGLVELFQETSHHLSQINQDTVDPLSVNNDPYLELRSERLMTTFLL